MPGFKVWMAFIEREIPPATAAKRLGVTEDHAASEMARVEELIEDRAPREEADRQLHTTWKYRG